MSTEIQVPLEKDLAPSIRILAYHILEEAQNWSLEYPEETDLELTPQQQHPSQGDCTNRTFPQVLPH